MESLISALILWNTLSYPEREARDYQDTISIRDISNIKKISPNSKRNRKPSVLNSQVS